MGSDSVIAAALASDLLDIGAVRFSSDRPFTWASGLRSPVYCDNRLTIGHVDVRSNITAGFRRIIEDERIGADVIAGTATAGIPHAAWLAGALDLPMVYVRSRVKEHGTGGRIEGPVTEGARVVLIEDLVSTGGSSIDAAIALREAGMDVRAVLAIFSYGLAAAREAFTGAGIPLHVLTNIDALIEEAARGGRLDEATIRLIRSWRNDPEAWSRALADGGHVPR